MSEVAPATAGQVFLGETGKVDAVEFHHVIAQRLKYAAHDAVAARVNLDAGLLAVGGRYVTYCIGVDGAIVEFNTVGDVLHVLLADGLVGPHLVDLLLDILGVGEFGGQVTIVGEQEHASGIAVETTHGIDALLAGSLHKVHNGLAAVGIITGGDAILGFVEQDVALLLGGDNLAIIFNDVLRSDLHAEFGHNIAIDLDQTLLDVFVSHAARADAGVGHELVEANLHVGIDSGLLINDALGLGCESHLGLGTLALGTLLITALALLVATLALLVTALTLLVATLTLLVAALALLVTALLTRLVAALLTRLVATLLTRLVAALLAMLVAALLTRLVTALLTGLVAALLTRLVAALLLGVHCAVVARVGSVVLTGRHRLLVALLITALTGLITALTLVAALALITTLALLVATLALVAALALISTLTMVTALLTGLVTFLLLETLGMSCRLVSLMRFVGAIFYFLIASFNIVFKIAVSFTDSRPFRFFQILVHR